MQKKHVKVAKLTDSNLDDGGLVLEHWVGELPGDGGTELSEGEGGVLARQKVLGPAVRQEVAAQGWRKAKLSIDMYVDRFDGQQVCSFTTK